MNDFSSFTCMKIRIDEAVAAVIKRTQYAGEVYIGMIDPPLELMGNIVIQHVGRGKIVFHDPVKLNFVPIVGGVAEIRYDVAGFGCVVSQGVASSTV